MNLFYIAKTMILFIEFLVLSPKIQALSYNSDVEILSQYAKSGAMSMTNNGSSKFGAVLDVSGTKCELQLKREMILNGFVYSASLIEQKTSITLDNSYPIVYVYKDNENFMTLKLQSRASARRVARALISFKRNCKSNYEIF